MRHIEESMCAFTPPPVTLRRSRPRPVHEAAAKIDRSIAEDIVQTVAGRIVTERATGARHNSKHSIARFLGTDRHGSEAADGPERPDGAQATRKLGALRG